MVLPAGVASPGSPSSQLSLSGSYCSPKADPPREHWGGTVPICMCSGLLLTPPPPLPRVK